MIGKTLISCVGDAWVDRRYRYCTRCRRGMAGFDAWAGLKRDSLTPRGRRMAVLAGSKMSFDASSDHLRDLCGLRISDQTIRRACDGVGREAKAYLEESRVAVEAVAQVHGRQARECTMDGAKVNTVEGWREIRGVVACRREPGEPASVRQWKKRNLPKPAARLAWAAIADSEQVGAKVQGMADRLGWDLGRGVSVLGDGIPWIWKQSRQHLPEHEGCLDIWHLMEHLHAAGRALHGEGDPAKRWAELQRALIFRHGSMKYFKRRLAPQVNAHRRADPGGEKARALRSLLLYLWKHRGRMNYRDRLRRGLPIGSGQIEGVCKNTLNRRLRKNSPRWRPERANHMAALCCLHTSNQWDPFWSKAA